MNVYIFLGSSCLRDEHILKRFTVKYGMKAVDSRLMKFGILWGELSETILPHLRDDALVKAVL